MISLLKMPKLSPTMEVGTIVKWHKSSGDKIGFGDVLVEISTDKAVLEHTASEDGWFRECLIKEGTKVQIGTPIAVISSEKDESFNLEELLPKSPSSQPSPENSEQKEEALSDISHQGSSMIVSFGFKPEPPLSKPLSLKQDSSKSPVSPLAKRVAKEKNLDISGIKGSGPGGRIVEKDLEKAPAKGIAGFGYPEAPEVHPGAYNEESLSPVREIIAQRLQAAKTFIPHFYVRQKVYTSPLLALLKELQIQGIKLSINDCIVRACALTLKEFPEINSGFNSVDNKIVRFETIDISIAVAIPDGVITPIVRCADRKNIGMISAEIKSLASKAKSQSLKEEEFKGGSFCVSNLGMTGITEFTAIINPPQAAILAVGSTHEEPVVVNGDIVIGSTCMLTLSIDHRVIDGYPAAMFMKRLQKILEAPSVLLLN
ncbi:Dihydrolipoyllysine-residue succinyltransferase component of 2-oxoglutarate dehydrogenase complex,branched-chain alpha-keto acid dehydrogenase subunit E2,pyruvate dehydrogenase complex dihydrolipoamide acetyltransferase,2-oxoacid dehydrogenases acyltransferase (catalytic domain) [Chlamydia poikilotherma]|uniref:Acetyltransferase component of pyruvate dehydrogenase complex n=1 Tax=Chlamydia poikilotherma TaxID=1967783 RepID=A0A3B0PMH9_9CHLA|nr:pyruvate dehydrogenase complex dihydrolipoamide acetyltransferase [Chlamydia poikilotherma]SYX08959.1 Dihydrolipoyllysine-residue succinyltransferase component of 2-oxoglutarate dehydrogenase complex,branched-chain alpha-keto acid dehydrogenase subunit E2,pyruvate dehydrogenase complex dihydrolipoamide acetyltransferase,2-oxoacid dehydrogenases acyltransferase (catalytic domain) [Chlamydia poikilotherma]